MFYSKIYPASWKLIRNNWALVIFGAFAYTLGFNELSLMYSLGDSGSDMLASLLQSFYYSLYVVSISEITLANLPTLLMLALIFMFYAALVIMAVSSQGALIISVKEKELSFREKLRVGLDKFWSLLTLNLLNTIIGYFFVVIIIDQLVFMLANFDIGWLSNLLISMIIFFIFIPFIIAVAFVTRYCASYVVLENQDVDSAFLNGWRLFRINWLITVENAFFLLLLTIVYFMVLMAVKNYLVLFVLATLPYLSIDIIHFINSSIFLLGSALYAAYYNVLWANVWIALTGDKKKHSKIHRVAAKTLPRLAK